MRRLNQASSKEVSGGSDETKILIKFVDDILSLMIEQSTSSDNQSIKRITGCRLVGHSFQLITGLLVDKCPSAKFAQASGGQVFEINQEVSSSLSLCNFNLFSTSTSSLIWLFFSLYILGHG